MIPRLAAGLIAVALLAACGAPAPSVTQTAEPSPAPTGCPNTDDGVCPGPLVAGMYSTTGLRTPLTYSIPDGWSNTEDLPGSFVLVPPGATSDFIGVYDGFAAASADCEESAQPGIEATPEAMAEWYAGLPGLEVSESQSVSIGGVFGLVFNAALAESHTGACPGAEDLPAVPLLVGEGPASIHHVVVGGTTTRLFLLSAPDGQTIAIVVSNAGDGVSLEELDSVVHTFEFALPAS